MNKSNEVVKTDKELLRQQLQLLAERSKKANSIDLPIISSVMVDILKVLKDC